MKKSIITLVGALALSTLSGCFGIKTASGHSMYYDRTGEDVKAGYADPVGNQADIVIPKINQPAE